MIIYIIYIFVKGIKSDLLIVFTVCYAYIPAKLKMYQEIPYLYVC